LIFVVSPLALGPIARYRVLIGKLCADAVAFRKPAGIAATKPLAVLVAPPEGDVVADTVVKLAVVGVGFDEVEVCVGAEAATERDDGEEDPQPARASAAVAASATAPYRIDDRESAMLTGLLLGDREMWMPPAPESCAAIGVGRAWPQAPLPSVPAVGDTGLDPMPYRCRPTPPKVSAQLGPS
jgi:hypothetical protein